MMRSLLLQLSGCLLIWAWLTTPARAQTAPPSWKWVHSQRQHPQLGASSLASDSQGNVYVAGAYLDSVRLGPGTVFKHSYGGYLAKYSTAGALVWARELTGTTGGRIILDAAGNLYLGGTVSGGATALQIGSLSVPATKLVFCGYLAKLDAQGNPQWLRTVGSGTTGDCEVGDMGLDASGNIYLSGLLTGTVNFGAFTLSTGGPATSSPNDVFLLKLDPQGTPLWGRQGGRTTTTYSTSVSLTVSAGGDCYLTGATALDTAPFAGLPLPAKGGFCDVLLLKYNTQGAPQWLQRYPAGAAEELGIAHGAVLDGLGRLVVPLEYKGRLNLGSQTLDAGNAVRNGALATFDAATGNLVWVASMQSPAYSFGYAVAADAANNLYFLGEFSYSTIIGGQTLTTPLGRAGVVACFSPQGTMRWVKQVADAEPYLVAIGGGQLSVAGTYQGAPAFDNLVLPQYNYTLTQSNGLFVAQFGTLALAERSGQSAQPLALFPNPTRSSVTLPALPPGTQVYLTDALGRTVLRPSSLPVVNVGSLAPGLYQVQAVAPNGQHWHSPLAVE